MSRLGLAGALMLLSVAGCSSPGLRYQGVTPVTVTEAGYRFDVYAVGDRAQVIRTNATLLPSKWKVLAAAVAATEKATGCRVPQGSVRGDSAIANMRLEC